MAIYWVNYSQMGQDYVQGRGVL